MEVISNRLPFPIHLWNVTIYVQNTCLHVCNNTNGEKREKHSECSYHTCHDRVKIWIRYRWIVRYNIFCFHSIFSHVSESRHVDVIKIIPTESVHQNYYKLRTISKVDTTEHHQQSRCEEHTFDNSSEMCCWKILFSFNKTKKMCKFGLLFGHRYVVFPSTLPVTLKISLMHSIRFGIGGIQKYASIDFLLFIATAPHGTACICCSNKT